MKKRSKLLTLLLSTSLACTNMSIVYAANTSTTEVSTTEESLEEPSSESLSGSLPDSQPTGTNGQTETPVSESQNTESSSSEKEPETAKETETAAESISGEQGTESTSEEQSSENASEEQNTETASEEQNTENASEEPETETVPEESTEAETESASAENTFINKKGETITPSALVGVDYSTVVDTYDGETNVIKQYQTSDTYEANVIMGCSVDENGNLILIISKGSAAPAPVMLEGTQGSSNSAPAVDGNFSGWDDIPASYEYNWDNSSNCWQNGCWTTDPVTGEDICYKTEEGTYDSNVRHEMQMYCDDANVYLKIKYATIYGSHANGEDFNFYIDGVGAKFQLTWPDGTPITGTVTESGTYVIDIRNGDSSSSYSIVDGACAYYYVSENGINNEVELKIPLSALQAQNGNINLDNFSMIQFFTPNLMYRPISAAGSPTGSVPFAAAAFLGIPASYVLIKKKNELERAFT